MHGVTALAAGALVMLLLPLAGCWDEVHYQPGNTTPHTEDVHPDSAPQAPEATPNDAPPPSEGYTAAPASLTRPANETDSPPPSSGDVFDDSPALAPPATGVAEPSAEDPVLPAPESTGAAAPADDATLPIVSEVASSPAPSDRRDAWTAVSNWSLAAAICAKGYPPKHYQSYLDDAERTAAGLDIDLPPLPAADGTRSLETIALEELRGAPAAQLAAAVGDRIDAAAAAAARFAIDAHVLLLAYSPQSSDAAAVASSLRDAATAAQLPAELWQPLVTLLDERADFRAVRTAVFGMREKVAQYLAEQAEP